MGTEIAQANYERDGLGHASDATDGEWESIEGHLPGAKAPGRPRTTDLREAVNAILVHVAVGLSVAAAAQRVSAALDSAAAYRKSSSSASYVSEPSRAADGAGSGFVRCNHKRTHG